MIHNSYYLGIIQFKLSICLFHLRFGDITSTGNLKMNVNVAKIVVLSTCI